MTIKPDFPLPGEEEKAKEEIEKLPESLREFFVPHYQIYGRKETGAYVGLVCRCCNHWKKYGHDDDCPVRKIE